MKKKNLTEKERYYIEIALKKHTPVVQIAKDLGRARSTIYKEIKRGLCWQIEPVLWKDVEVYCADVAERKYKENMHRTGRKYKLNSDDVYLQAFKDIVLTKKYSPEAAVFVLGRKVCVKTLYNYVHMGYISGMHTLSLPYAKKHKRKKRGTVKRKYVRGRSIDDRPSIINDRATYGHWEMDTVYSNKYDRTCLLVLTERMTREEIIEPIKDRTSQSVVRCLNRLEKRMGTSAFRRKFLSITCDNGMEFANWKGIEKSCMSQQQRTITYFCHPYRSGERGSNENQNKMIRRWIPKGDDIGLYSRQEIKEIESWINHYPRGIFGGLSTADFLKLKTPL